MDSTKSRKFKSYNALMLALRKSELLFHGSISSLLLECFLEDGGRLQASKAVARGICEEGKFSIWRDNLVKKGWLTWSATQNDKGQYFPGKKLLPYINKEKLVSKEIATRDEVTATRNQVEATRDEVADLRAQLNSHEERFTKIDEAVQELRRAVEPPDSEEKRKAREMIAEKLTNLSVIN